jgi:CheY-like chemotaxis protein
MMPKIDGLEVCRRLKGDPATATIRIIAITGFPDNFTERSALNAGADAFLVKSFDIPMLRTALRRLLGTRLGAAR